MCGKGGGGGKTTNVTKNYPDWYEKATERTFNKAEQTLGKRPEERIYQGQTLAPFNQMQQRAIGQAGENYGKFQPELNQIGAMLQKEFNSPLSKVSTERRNIDINSQNLHSPSGQRYLSDFAKNVYEPAAERLNREAGRTAATHERQNLGRRFNSNYALGRVGLEEARLNNLRQLGSDVFQQALGAFNTDEARRLQAQVANEQAQEAQLGRLLGAQSTNQAAELQNKGLNEKLATTMLNNIMTKYNISNEDIRKLFAYGTAGQEMSQKELDEIRRKWDTMNNFDRSEIEWLMNLTHSIPSTGSTSTATQPRSNPLQSLAGPVLGTITRSFL